jgi:hypothetical protein
LCIGSATTIGSINFLVRTYQSSSTNYLATTDFPTAIDRINDAGTDVESMAATWPKPKMVLGGYSQRAAAMGFVTAKVPDGARLMEILQPMPSEVADHVAAVALFGKPSEQFITTRSVPARETSPYTVSTWRREWSTRR